MRMGSELQALRRGQVVVEFAPGREVFMNCPGSANSLGGPVLVTTRRP
jgi:hypothetical protein